MTLIKVFLVWTKLGDTWDLDKVFSTEEGADDYAEVLAKEVDNKNVFVSNKVVYSGSK